ncbi:MAG: FAD-dependent oxidoreductase [Candidatus Pacebacteria bacterium]|nr:FAD-dependent oxidoreductase [Candidatus Paceibacterota bacterium]
MIKILILGGGFGGIRCALDCAKKFKGEASITIIDRNSYHTFTPALYEIASANQPTDDPFALKLRKAVSIPYQDIFENKNINYIQAEIASVNVESSEVALIGGKVLNYDYLVVSLGSQAYDFGIPGVVEYAYPFKTVNDAVALHSKLEKTFLEASVGQRSLPIKFLIIGAGFTGIELASELAIYAKKIGPKYGLNGRYFSSVLFESSSCILPATKDSERKIIGSRLTQIGVVLMCNSVVESVSSESVKLSNGQVVSGSAVIWTAGVKPNILASGINGLIFNNAGKITVGGTMMCKNFKNIFALGDCAEFIDPVTQKSVPGLAYVAKEQGEIVAKNIYRSVFNKKLLDYVPNYDYWVAPAGGKFVVARLGKNKTLYGVSGWLVRALIDFKYFFSILSLQKSIKLFYRDLILFSKND